MNLRRPEEMFSILVVLMLVATAIWYSLRPTAVPIVFAGPAPEELDSLSRYLQPVGAAPEIDNYDMFVPAGEPVYRPSRAISAGAPAPQPFVPRSRRLTAILLVGDRPTAIIDDEQVSAGTQLPGGTEVLAIGRSEVTLREPDGSRRSLRISAGN